MLFEPKRHASVMVFFMLVLPSVYLSNKAAEPVALPTNNYLEDMTWLEVKKAIDGGATRVIVPTGGTEQNGPHVILGKHNYIVKYTSGEIAKILGNTLVAPVISYVPEGSINPPEGHMKFSGTLSVSEPEFEAVLESTARSLKQHGFKTIAFIGDSGGNQAAQKRVSERLTKKWQGEGIKVLNINDYYEKNSQLAYLRSNGFTDTQIGHHAGIRDTSELMAVLPAGVRTEFKKDHSDSDFVSTGTDGDAGKASLFLGNILLNLKIEAAVTQIRQALENEY